MNNTILVQTNKRDFEIKVNRVVGVLAIHRLLSLHDPNGPVTLSAKGWALTHIPSGKAIPVPWWIAPRTGYPTLRTATTVAEKLSRIPGIGKRQPSRLCGRRVRKVLKDEMPEEGE